MTGTLEVGAITVDHAVYAKQRAAARARMIPLRRARRLRVGDILAFAFENAETLTYQVQEMVFTERLSDPAELQHEIDLYGRMLPDSHSLVATLLVELTDPAAVRAELARLEGLQQSISLLIGPPGAAHRVRAEEIPGADEDPEVPGPLTSVHVFRFRLTDAARDAFRDPAQPAELVVDHPHYADGADIDGATRTALLADLALSN